MTKLGYIAILRHLLLLVVFPSSRFEVVVTVDNIFAINLLAQDLVP